VENRCCRLLKYFSSQGLFAFLSMLIALLGASCAGDRKTESAAGEKAAPVRSKESKRPEKLRMATTTSTENSGLLDFILPDFEKKTGVRVDVLATGSGKALKLGENGDVDILMVHSPEDEKEFIRAGFGTARTVIMYNDFIIAGPAGDPAGIKGAASAAEALKIISGKRQPFISRGDDSGTHKMELSLWESAGIEPEGTWYMEVGQGMGAALITAEEKQAYVLADRGTYLSMADKLKNVPLLEGDPALLNIYSAIPVNPAKNPEVRLDLAEKFLGWITSAETEKLISDFKVGGKQLFFPVSEDEIPGSR